MPFGSFVSRRRSLSLLAVVACGLALLSAAPAAHAGFKFGPEENLRPLADVRLQNSAKEALFIGHKVTFYWIGLPVSFSDDGYILGVKGKSLYYPLDKDRLAEWQAQGLLPSPLPGYTLSAADWVFAHLLWLVLAGWALFSGVRALLTRFSRRPGKTLPAQPTPRAQEKDRAAAIARAMPDAPAQPPRDTALQPSPARLQPAAGEPPRAAPGMPTLAHMRAEAAKLPVAKTVCRVKALKAA